MGNCTSKKDHSGHIPPVTKKVDKNSADYPATKTGEGSALSGDAYRKGNKTYRVRLISTIHASGEGGNAVVGARPQNSKQISFIKESCMSNFIFRELSESMLNEVIRKMKHHAYQVDVDIFTEKEGGKQFYVLISGTVDIMSGGEVKSALSKGATFGELALLNDTPRTATIRTTSKCECWALDRKEFRLILKRLNKANHAEIAKFIDDVEMFSLLSEHQREQIISALTLQKFENGEAIIREGDAGDLFYLIKEGDVVASVEGKEIRRMGKGNFFGEQALLYDAGRTATVTAQGEVECLALSRGQLEEAFGANLKDVLYKRSIIIALEKSQHLEMLQTDQKSLISETVSTKSYERGQVVVPVETKVGSGLWIVLKGSLSGSGMTLNLFDMTGDAHIQDNSQEVHSSDLTAVTDSDIGFIDKQKFEAIIGGNVTSVAQSNIILKALGQISLFKTLSTSKLKDLAGVLRVREYQSGEKIISEGETSSEFYILKDGAVDIIKGTNEHIRTLSKLQCFGERAVILEETRSASAVATAPNTQCWVMGATEFRQVMDANVVAHLTKRMELQDDTIQLSDLGVIRELGAGMFGSVYLCSHKTKQTIYAVKSIVRKKIDKYMIHENVKAERNLLLNIDNTMIMKLVKTFKDSHRIYFLMEYIHGIDLFDAIREIGVVDNEQAKFFMGCLTLAIEHLAEKKIVHRDLKPENVMVDVDGYAKLIDFGTAKIMKSRTYTIVGTPHYMAPEVIRGKGYNVSVDLWSLGIMLFEFIGAGVPFGEGFEDSYAVYEAVIHQPLRFPKMVTANHPAKPIIMKLLSRNASQRGTADTLKKDVWFRGMDWEALSYHFVKPKYMPKHKQQDPRKVIKGTIESIMLRDEARDPIAPGKGVKPAPAGWDDEF